MAALRLPHLCRWGERHLLFVTASSKTNWCQQMDEGGWALLERVKNWELLEADKSVLHILIYKKD